MFLNLPAGAYSMFTVIGEHAFACEVEESWVRLDGRKRAEEHVLFLS